MTTMMTAAEVARGKELLARVQRGCNAVLLGQEGLVDLCVIALCARGHLLLEGLPGLGKTELVKALGQLLGLSFRRVQFTPDLLPGDVTGGPILQERSGERRFEFQPGPLFANVVLADEINRASPKTQSALLESMEERQVTVDAVSYALPRPFVVIATQNPIELEGTYPLPEAQLDRFLMRIPMGYPDRLAELAILDHQGGGQRADDLGPVTTADDVMAAVNAITQVHVAPALAEYIVDLVGATRVHGDLLVGVSPRGALALQRAARALAASESREYVIPDDIRWLAPAVLEHRLILSPDAELHGVTQADVVRDVLARVPVPRAGG